MDCFFISLRDILPFTLKLPEAIASAKTQKELEEVAQLGAGTIASFFTILGYGSNTHLERPGS